MSSPKKIPTHLPVDMAFAPKQDPYKHIHPPTNQSHNTDTNKLAQHSLSPEKLGVVGYVKDVAGFVKDAVQEHSKKKKHDTAISSSPETKRLINVNEYVKNEEHAHKQEEDEEKNKRHSHGLADAVTGLFPGVVNADGDAAVCTHTEELKSQMMNIHEHQHAFNDGNTRKLL